MDIITDEIDRILERINKGEGLKWVDGPVVKELYYNFAQKGVIRPYIYCVGGKKTLYTVRQAENELNQLITYRTPYQFA